MTEFNFQKETSEIHWTVEGLIPAGHLAVVLAQAGVGKSLVVEYLAVCAAYGEKFCSYKTLEGNVLLIDQDTPTNVLERRLKKFGLSMQPNQKYKLYVESMNQYSLSNGSLIRTINNYPSCKLVIIDSLHSVCGKLNPNKTNDMGILAQLKQECLTNERTIIINHHISEKARFSLEELMADGAHSFAMGNSAIIQQADTYYIIGAEAADGITSKIFLRPIAKRVSVSSRPIVLKIISPTQESERLEYFGMYEPGLNALENDILMLFVEQPNDRTIKDVYEAIGHMATEKEIRDALANLEKQGKLVMNRKAHNMFKYRLP